MVTFGWKWPHNKPYVWHHRHYPEPLEKEEAEKLVEQMLRSASNPRLKRGNVEEKKKRIFKFLKYWVNMAH